MTKLKLAALLVVAAIATGIFSAAGLPRSASAQEISIRTSADDHDNRFFGEGVLQVVVTDPDSDNDSTIENVSVEIEAEPDAGSGGSADISVPETSEGSGRFEFFLAHVDATAVGPEDLDPLNTAGVEGDGSCAADCAPFITFGPGGDVDAEADLYEEIRFEISAGNTEIISNYEEADGELDLDRDLYGTTSFVYISVRDQDANLNPFDNDEFTLDPDSAPNEDLLAIDGGTFEEVIVFRETGDNTAIFEGKYRLGVSIMVDSESLALTLHDKANYYATLEAPENDSNNTDEISFTVSNSDGTVEVEGSQQVMTWDPTLAADKSSYAMGESVQVTITDQDANSNSSTADSIQLWVSSGDSEIEILAIETGSSTGIFEARFTLAAETDAGAEAIAADGDVTIRYTDERPADYSENVSEGQIPEKDFTLKVDVIVAVKTGIESATVAAPAVTGSGPHAIGTPLTLSTTISNNNGQQQPFVAIIEVRDSDGITVFLALQSGTLDPSGFADIEALWQPENGGTFQLRTFAFSETDVLSPVAVSEITVT